VIRRSRRRIFAILGASMASIALAMPATAQERSAKLLIEEADASAHPVVRLTVSMPSEFVGIDLGADAFTIVENGEPIEDLAVTGLPSDDLEVVLALDVSGSMKGGPLGAAQDAALSFIEAMPPGVRIAVVTFADETAVASEFTTDKDAVADSVVGLSTSGETALYDGLVLASQQFDPNLPARRSVVLLSDGGDTVSDSTLEQALVGLLGNTVSFYAIELQTPENDPDALSRLAAATDGTVVAATDPEALGGIFDEIAAQLVNRYTVTYRSEAFGPTDVEITVAAGDATASALRSIRLPAAPDPPAEPEPIVEPEPTAEPEAPTVRPGVAVELDLFQRSAAFYAGLLLLLGGMAGALVATRNARVRKRSILVAEPTATPPAPKRTGLTAIADRAVTFADRSIQGERSGRINTRLEQAGIAMRPAEFVVLGAVAVIVGLSIGWILFGPLGGLAGLAVAFVVVLVALRHKANQRMAAFAEQLPDTLHLMAGGLRAGFGLLQAIEVVAAEAPSPTAEEFQRVKVEIQLGRDMDDALKAMASRVGSEDFRWVSDGIQIHREVGGDIAEIIDSVNATIRARNQTRRRIKALSAEGRVSATVLIVLPIALFFIITFANPGYIGELTGSSIGRVLIGAGIVGMVVGVVWIRQIIRLEF
jgi:tight adherence protein B